MVKTVAAAFDELHGRLTPLRTEIEAASRHRASVEAALKSGHSVNRFFQSGSWGNGTSVRSQSDVDYFASISYEEEPSDSYEILKRVQRTLQARFPRTTVLIDTPAVTILFGSGGSERYEVVPAFIEDTSDQTSFVYRIVDIQGGWLRSSPEGQKLWVAGEDHRLGDRLRPLIRFLKHWKYTNDVPISSYYLEVFATRCVRTMDLIVHSFDLPTILGALYTAQAPPVENPGRVGGSVRACESWDRKELLEALLEATVHADLAHEADQEGNTERSFRWWSALFKGSFPTYG
jgi:hypothetical protein